jgi:methylmalonyl-CoA mutase, C-terminal domain
MTSERRIRVLVAKPGLDGHNRGALIVARALRDAGMEVVYTGLRQSPEQIVAAALQEDVDLIGLSVLSGAHLTIAKRVMELLVAADMGAVHVFVGGIIPAEDVPVLEQLGVAQVLLPGTSTQDIVQAVREAVGGAPARAVQTPTIR